MRAVCERFLERVDAVNAMALGPEQSARTLDRIVEMFRPVFREIRHEDPELAVRAGLLAVTLAMRQLVVTGKPLQGSLRVPQAKLESELQRMFLRYLGLS